MSNLEVVDNSKKATLLFLAILENALECVEVLLAHDADATETHNGFTPRQLAQALHHTSISDCLEKHLERHQPLKRGC